MGQRRTIKSVHGTTGVVSSCVFVVHRSLPLCRHILEIHYCICSAPVKAGRELGGGWWGGLLAEVQVKVQAQGRGEGDDPAVLKHCSTEAVHQVSKHPFLQLELGA